MHGRFAGSSTTTTKSTPLCVPRSLAPIYNRLWWYNPIVPSSGYLSIVAA